MLYLRTLWPCNCGACFFNLSAARHSADVDFLPILLGCLAGSITSMLSAYFLCEFLGLGQEVALSTLPESTTAPIALAVTSELGGTASITMAAVMTTGVMGAYPFPLCWLTYFISKIK